MIENEFNTHAGKIVSCDELMDKYNALLHADNLSFKEESLTGIEMLATLVTKPISKLRSFKASVKEKFQSAANDGTSGHYKSHGLFGNRYVNTAVLPLRAKEDISLSLTPKLTEKLWNLTMKAAEECQDFSVLRDEGHLKPTRIKLLF